MNRLLCSLFLSSLVFGAALSPAQAHTHKVEFSLADVKVPDVEILDQDARALNFKTLLSGRRAVITFQFADCNSLCPATHVVMQELQEMMAQSPDSKDILLLSITLNPEEDTPEKMKEKAGEFGAGENWLWLTGSSDSMLQIYRALGVPDVPKENHDVFFLLGNADQGTFQRVSGLPAPELVFKALQHLGH